jgi:hypothetical protein
MKVQDKINPIGCEISIDFRVVIALTPLLREFEKTADCWVKLSNNLLYGEIPVYQFLLPPNCIVISNKGNQV